MADSDDRDETTSPGSDGMVDSDDTTQADAGMAGGTGTAEEDASVTPQATGPHADEDDLDD